MGLRSVTLASTVGSPSVHRRGIMLKLLSVLVLILTIGVGNVWGVAFAPSNFSGQGTSGTGSAISATVDGVTFACDKGYGTTQIRCYSGGKITISSSSTITAISFTFSGSYTGGLETSYTNLSTTSWTKTLTSQARITACTVTVAATYSVVWTIDPSGYGTLSKTTGTTTTVTPGSAYTYGSPAYTVTSGGATVSQSTNTFTATPTANCTIRINMVEKPKYTVTLKDDETGLTQTSYGASVTLPSRTGCDGYTFAGWTKTWTSAQTEWTTTAPTIIPAGSYTPQADENLYPVYTKTEGGGTTYQFQKVTALSQIKAGGTFIITNGSYYLPNGAATNAGPAVASMVTVTNGVVTGTVTDAMKWTFSAADANNRVTIKSVANSNNYLYSTSDNNGLRVSTTSDSWTFEEYTVSSVLGFAMKSTSNSRYCAVYSTSNWRSYTTKNHNNYSQNSGRLDLYKYTAVNNSTTSYISVPNCCSPLGSINGSVFWPTFFSYLTC